MGLPSENLTPTQTDGVAAFAAQLGTWAPGQFVFSTQHHFTKHERMIPQVPPTCMIA